MAYHEHTDGQYMRKLRENAPAAFQGFADLGENAIRAAGNPIDVKNASLIALAVGLTTQCVYCIEAHSKEAFEAGATEQEIAQTTMIATAVRAGGGFAHGFLAMKFYEQAAAEAKA